MNTDEHGFLTEANEANKAKRHGHKGLNTEAQIDTNFTTANEGNEGPH
jgi:hypothetical protein